MKIAKSLVFAACIVVATGCASKKPKPETDPTLGSDAAAQSQGVDGQRGSASAMDGSQHGAGDLLSTLVIYFDYDSAQVRSEFVSVVNAHGRNLAENPNAKLRLEGHADERGSREYNIALSEYRADAVRNLMRFQGVREGQIETVAFGEEKPAVSGRGESAWAQNRRVEIVYEAQ